MRIKVLFLVGRETDMSKSNAKKTASQIVSDSRKKLVETLIQKMQDGVHPVREMWNSVGMYGLPHNPISGARYQGVNLLRLLMASVEQKYEDPRWMTLKQANNQGYRIKKGAKSVLLEKWIWSKVIEEENENGEIEKKMIKLRNPYVNFFRVFNAEQIDGIGPIPKVIPMEKNEMLQVAEEVIASSQCEIVEAMQPRAYYSPTEDKIMLPPRDHFKSQEAFLAVTLHEMSHSTGHPDRLNRSLNNKFGTPEYAKEELNAEFGSAFLQMDLGIQLSDEAVNDHAAYLQSWISVLENDPNELFRAVHNASEISDYLIENYQEYQEEQQNTQQKQISQIQSEELSNSGNAKLKVAIKRAVKAGSIEAGLKYLEKSELRHPDDVEGHRLVKEKYLENVKEFLPEQQEAEMLGFSSVEELQDKIKQGMPIKNYDTSALIHQVSEALDGNYKQENIWEAEQENWSETSTYEQENYTMPGNESVIEEDIELEITMGD